MSHPIETALARTGIVFKKAEQLELLNTSTGELDLAHASDEIKFEVEQFNKQVVTTEFNRVVAEELTNHIDPALPGKTLVFAATDAHADIGVKTIRRPLLLIDRMAGGSEPSDPAEGGFSNYSEVLCQANC